jgi:hypothetical protein
MAYVAAPTVLTAEIISDHRHATLLVKRSAEATRRDPFLDGRQMLTRTAKIGFRRSSPQRRPIANALKTQSLVGIQSQSASDFRRSEINFDADLQRVVWSVLVQTSEPSDANGYAHILVRAGDITRI